MICDLCACTSTATTKVTEVSTRAVTKQCAHVAVRNHQRADARQTTCGAEALCIAHDLNKRIQCNGREGDVGRAEVMHRSAQGLARLLARRSGSR